MCTNAQSTQTSNRTTRLHPVLLLTLNSLYSQRVSDCGVVGVNDNGFRCARVVDNQLPHNRVSEHNEVTARLEPSLSRLLSICVVDSVQSCFKLTPSLSWWCRANACKFYFLFYFYLSYCCIGCGCTACSCRAISVCATERLALWVFWLKPCGE